MAKLTTQAVTSPVTSPSTAPNTDGPLTVGGEAPLLLIAGPCVIESWELLCTVAEGILDATDGLPYTVVFKASYDKANRSSKSSFRGPGIEEGLELLGRVKERFRLPVTADVHTPAEAALARDVLDIVQIPAYLCRQNDLLTEAAATERIVNIKKGQFLSPAEMPQRIAAAAGPDGRSRAIATERGTFFGYNNLVNDFRGIVQMRRAGIPTIFDATHSVQRPAAEGDKSGGDRTLVPALARAAAAVGVDGFFFEVHPEPERALCDGPNCLRLAQARDIFAGLAELDDLLRRSNFPAVD